MKRVIKFKAWHEHLQMMFTVYSLDFDNGLVFCESEEDTRHTFGMIDVELLQFTGYQDKNGADIYEGDIASKTYKYQVTESGQIKFMESGFCVFFDYEPEAYYYLGGESKSHEIIGNIYQHKELLE